MVYIEYSKIVVGTKSPQEKISQKIQNLTYMSVYQNIHRIW